MNFYLRGTNEKRMEAGGGPHAFLFVPLTHTTLFASSRYGIGFVGKGATPQTSGEQSGSGGVRIRDELP